MESVWWQRTPRKNLIVWHQFYVAPNSVQHRKITTVNHVHRQRWSTVVHDHHWWHQNPNARQTLSVSSVHDGQGNRFSNDIFAISFYCFYTVHFRLIEHRVPRLDNRHYWLSCLGDPRLSETTELSLGKSHGLWQDVGPVVFGIGMAEGWKRSVLIWRFWLLWNTLEH